MLVLGRGLYGACPKIGVKHPKWMVFFLENPIKSIKIDDLGGPPLFLETTISVPKKSSFLNNRNLAVAAFPKALLFWSGRFSINGTTVDG